MLGQRLFALLAHAVLSDKILLINDTVFLRCSAPLLRANLCIVGLVKQGEEYGWLSHVHSQVLQQCLKDLDRAYTNCFAGRTAPPQYRKKFLSDSFRYPQGFKVDGRQLYLPNWSLANLVKRPN